VRDRLTACPVSPPARASARKRAAQTVRRDDATTLSTRRLYSTVLFHRVIASALRAAYCGRTPREVVPAKYDASRENESGEVNAYRKERERTRKGTLGGSNRMLSARDVAAILGIPERTVRDKWREWELPAYRIGRHLRWKERDLNAWIERQAA
jgi:excisionase family DNA binding protein